MIRKSILALTAIAALGTVALAPTSASAWGFKGGFHHHHGFGWGHGFGVGFVGGGYGGGYDGCWQTRRVWTPFGFRWRTVNVCY